jgi:uncharacterized Tic20 family protein
MDYDTASASAMPSTDERNWAMAAHLGPIAAMVLSAGAAAWLVPLVIWLIKRDEQPWIGTQAKEALNFQINLLLAAVAMTLLILVTLGLGALVAVPGFIFIAIANVVLAIIATMEVNKGVAYRYPWIVRIL